WELQTCPPPARRHPDFRYYLRSAVLPVTEEAAADEGSAASAHASRVRAGGAAGELSPLCW
ncbi:hypothetical protein B296_00018614, partial [Ensete ventricosum]